MDYANELRELLRPLGLYDVDSGLVGAGTAAVGEQLTGVWSQLETAERESLLATAEGAGLDAWEALMPFLPRAESAQARRDALAALLRIDGASFTPAAINETIAGCGIRAAVAEAAEPMTVAVSFPGLRGVPRDFPQLRWRIEQILPCHLAVVYEFDCLRWSELEQAFRTWAALEAGCGDWWSLEAGGG